MTPPFYARDVVQQLDIIGIGSLTVVVLTGLGVAGRLEAILDVLEEKKELRLALEQEPKEIDRGERFRGNEDAFAIQVLKRHSAHTKHTSHRAVTRDRQVRKEPELLWSLRIGQR